MTKAKSDLLARLVAPSMLAVAMLVCTPMAMAEASLVEDDSLRNWSAAEREAEMEAMRRERAEMSEQEMREARHEWTDMLDEPRWARGLSEERQRELMLLPPNERAMVIFRERMSREKGDPVERALDQLFGTPKQLGFEDKLGKKARGVQVADGSDATSGQGFSGGSTITRPPMVDSNAPVNDAARQRFLQREQQLRQRDQRLQSQSRKGSGADATMGRGGGFKRGGGMYGNLSDEERARLKGMSKEERRAYIQQRLQSMSPQERQALFQQQRQQMRDRWEQMSDEEKEEYRAKARERLASMDKSKRAQIAERMKERMEQLTPEQQEEFRQKLEQRMEGMSPEMREKFRSLVPE